MAAKAAAPKGAARLFNTMWLTTLSRFWMEAGTPTAHTPPAISLFKVNSLGEIHT